MSMGPILLNFNDLFNSTKITETFFPDYNVLKENITLRQSQQRLYMSINAEIP